MSVYTYQTMLLRKFYKFIKFKTVSKMFAANSPYVGPDSTRRAKFECGFQHWTIMSSNLTKSQSHHALASLVHAMVKKQCYIPALMNNLWVFIYNVSTCLTNPVLIPIYLSQNNYQTKRSAKLNGLTLLQS